VLLKVLKVPMSRLGNVSVDLVVIYIGWFLIRIGMKLIIVIF